MKSSLMVSGFLIFVVSGCSTTGLETAGKDQAKLTLSMMSELDGASKIFSTTHARSVAYLNRAAVEQQEGLLEARKTIAFELAGAAAVSDEKAQAIQKRLTALVASLEQNAVSTKTVDALEAETKTLLKPLPKVSPALADSKKAVAALIEGVSANTRYNELKAYADIARQSVKDAKATLAAPETVAPAPTVSN